MPFVDSGDVKLYYEEAGSGDAIIWIHEFAADYRTWEAQVRQFSRDYRCVTYNARGYPPSDVPEDGGAYTFDKQRDELCNEVGISVLQKRRILHIGELEAVEVTWVDGAVERFGPFAQGATHELLRGAGQAR